MAAWPECLAICLWLGQSPEACISLSYGFLLHPTGVTEGTCKSVLVDQPAACGMNPKVTMNASRCISR